MLHGSLIEGKKYKVRLKPLEELLEDYSEEYLFTEHEECWDVDSPHHTTNSQVEGLCKWFSMYLDGSVGYFTYSDKGYDSVSVRWDVGGSGDVWFYDLGQLKVLGEV